MAAGALGADSGSVCGDDADDSAVFAAGEGRIHAHADAASDAVGVGCADGGGYGVGISVGGVAEPCAAAHAEHDADAEHRPVLRGGAARFLFAATELRVKNRLRVLRAERNWSQADLAQRLEVSRQSVNAIETGKFDPSLPLAFRIARLFDSTIEAVFLDGEAELQ